MRDLLPAIAWTTISAQFEAAIRSARDGFEDLYADEDSLTGGIGQSLRATVKGNLDAEGTSLSWSTHVLKVRGRGPGAPEKRLGADAFLQFVVRDGVGVLRQKSVAWQAKKDWTGQDALLTEQSKLLSLLPGLGLVVDYRRDQYWAVRASAVQEADGDRRRISPDAFSPLDQMLAHDFLDCRVGSTSIRFDAPHQAVMVAERGGERPIPFRVGYYFRTVVRRLI